MAKVITGEQLRAQRVRRGLNRDQVAEVLGVNAKTISNWEGSNVPTARESQVRERFFTDTEAAFLETVSDLALVNEFMRRVTLARQVLGREEDRWQPLYPSAAFTAAIQDPPDPSE